MPIPDDNEAVSKPVNTCATKTHLHISERLYIFFKVCIIQIYHAITLSRNAEEFLVCVHRNDVILRTHIFF